MDSATILARARELGIDRAGVCTVEPFEEVRLEIERRKSEGLSDRLGFTFTDPERSTDVTRSHPWAQRLVVAARSYVPEAGDPGPGVEGTGRIARFATEDHYQPLRLALERLAGSLRDEGHEAEVLVDDNRLVDRAAAVRAGIGWWGKNTMVLTNRLGPWVLLGSVVTSAQLDTTPVDQRSCGTCSACLPACPTGALIAPGVLDARRCIAALLQQRGDLPTEFREHIGDRIYGCDDCLDACPPGMRLSDTATERRGREDLVTLLALSDADLDARFDRFYVPGRNMRFVRRNLLVALGNSGGSGAVPALAAYAHGEDALLVEHAIWALGRIGGPEARSVLEAIEETALDAEGARSLQLAFTRFEAPIGK
ncbi:MAG TPA: tRNA epoxyqueuosine(34) reductase QueG [Acidimicrobiia bacterium]